MSSQDLPLVSMVLPVFNEEKEIRNALAELGKQTYSNSEIIVVDDGSSDKTCEIAGEVGNSLKNFRVIRTKHRGPSSARNEGTKESKGDIVFFGECDCVYDADYLDKAVVALKKNPEAGAVCLTGGPLNLKSTLATDCIELENKLQHKLLEEGKIKPFYAWVFRREALEKTGGFDERLFQAEDKDLFRRVTEAGYKIAWVPGINWRHKRSETLSELSRKWFARGRTRVLYSLKHGLVTDLAKTLFPLWVFALGVLLLLYSPLVGGMLILLVLLLFLGQSLRIVLYVRPDSDLAKLVFIYPVFLIARNFSSGLGYSYGLLRYLGLRIQGVEITYDKV
ncbi:MAG: glycosyltransferase [Nitrososphaerota archaeon]|nr:glycosyltransferase [Nitrososphaerota archaeon]